MGHHDVPEGFIFRPGELCPVSTPAKLILFRVQVHRRAIGVGGQCAAATFLAEIEAPAKDVQLQPLES